MRCSALKKCLFLLTVSLLCVSLCACSAIKSFSLEDSLKKLKAYINGEEIPLPPDGYIESKESDEFAYDVFVDHIELTKYLGKKTDVTVPSELSGKPVTKVGSLTFYYGTPVVSLTLPEGITELSENALYYCSSLKTLSLPSSLETLGEKCFSWCSALEEIVLPEKITVLPAYCFNECTSLKKIDGLEHLTEVGPRAFSGCASLRNLVLPDTLTYVGDFAFRGCKALESVTLPGDCAFGLDAFAKTADGFAVRTAEDSPCWNACIEAKVNVKPSSDIWVPAPDVGGETQDVSPETTEEPSDGSEEDPDGEQ